MRCTRFLPAVARGRVGAAAVGLVAALLVAGCGTGTQPSAARQAPPSAGAASASVSGGVRIDRTGGSQVGEQAPAFTATTISGDRFALPAGKPAVIFFMAGWCGNCLPEAKALAAIHAQYGNKVAIVAVSPDPSDSPEAIAEFTKAAGARYPFAHDADGTLAAALAATALDTTVVTDAGGRIVYRDAVPTEEKTLRGALAKAGLA